MKNVFTNIDYNVLRSNNKVSKVTDYINDNNNKVHDILLRGALINLIRSNDYDWTAKYNNLNDEEAITSLINDFSIIEIRNNNLLNSSTCKFRQNYWPFKTWKIKLDNYWNNEYIKNFNNTKYTHITNNDFITSFNYVNGIAKTKGKLDGIIKEIPFNKINDNYNISEEYFLNKNTFTYLYINK